MKANATASNGSSQVVVTQRQHRVAAYEKLLDQRKRPIRSWRVSIKVRMGSEHWAMEEDDGWVHARQPAVVAAEVVPGRNVKAQQLHVDFLRADSANEIDGRQPFPGLGDGSVWSSWIVWSYRVTCCIVEGPSNFSPASEASPTTPSLRNAISAGLPPRTTRTPMAVSLSRRSALHSLRWPAR
jgi:hypothetical protein